MNNIFPNSARSESELRRARLLGQADADYPFTEHLRQMATASQPNKRRVGASVFGSVFQRRDLSASVASAGGYLVETSVNPIEALLPRYSLFGEGGLNVVSGLDGPVTIPRVKTVPVAGWIATDGVAPSGTADPAFGQMAMTPKFVSAKFNVSRQLLLMSQAEVVVGPLAAEAVYRAIDAAILGGTGSAGQPLGLGLTPGVGTQSGATLADAGLRAMRRQVLDAGAREDRLIWVGAPAVQETLGGREFSTGSGRPLWDSGKVLGLPAIASSLAPAGVLALGDWSRVTVTVFDGQGIELEFNPFENFQTGMVAFRLILPVDIGFSPAAAFCLASSVT